MSYNNNDFVKLNIDQFRRRRRYLVAIRIQVERFVHGS